MLLPFFPFQSKLKQTCYAQGGAEYSRTKNTATIFYEEKSSAASNLEGFLQTILDHQKQECEALEKMEEIQTQLQKLEEEQEECLRSAASVVIANREKAKYKRLLQQIQNQLKTTQEALALAQTNTESNFVRVDEYLEKYVNCRDRSRTLIFP